MSARPRKVRADELVLRQGLAESRSRAKTLIVAGEIRSGDRTILKPAELVDETLQLEVRAKLPYVSRGGLKLDHALNEFEIDATGMIAADLGASTGGFTDCLLQRGAAKVYAIDVGYGQLDYRLRSDPRVIVMERVNARYLEALPELVDFVCIDVSFISLRLILPVARRLLGGSGVCVALIKPQFEAGKESVGKGGVVRDPKVRQHVARQVVEAAQETDFAVRGLVPSPITGPAGNIEYLIWMTAGRDTANDVDIDEVFERGDW